MQNKKDGTVCEALFIPLQSDERWGRQSPNSSPLLIGLYTS